MKEYSFTTYNIFKTHLPFCKQVVGKFCKNDDFVAIQEWVSSLHIKNGNSISNCTTFTVPIRNVETGVATISKFPIISTSQFYSKNRELGFVTRKSMIMTTYDVDGKTLTIFNCHALNFVSNKLWHKTMGYWISQIPKDGCIIFAGDFNTWRPWRYEYLENTMEKLGFNYAHYNHNMILRLDHIFVRDLNIISTKLHDSVHTSDHYPITLRFTIKDEK